MIYVYKIPAKMSDGYCFGGGVPITFTNVDWFDKPEGDNPTDDELKAFIAPKVYAQDGAVLLVLSPRYGYCFTMGGTHD